MQSGLTIRYVKSPTCVVACSVVGDVAPCHDQPAGSARHVEPAANIVCVIVPDLAVEQFRIAARGDANSTALVLAAIFCDILEDFALVQQRDAT